MPSYREIMDRVAMVLLGICTAMALLPFAHIVLSTMVLGFRTIAAVGLEFLIEPPPPPGNELGGVGPALLGTLVVSAIATAIAVPLSMSIAVLVTEFPHLFLSRLLKVCIKALSDVPTIVISMLVYTLIVVPMGTFSALAGAIALTLVMLPYVATSMESTIESVPYTYREAGYAIGMKRHQVVRVIIGIARRGLALSVLMGLLRAMGETAPLLFTLGGAARFSYPSTVLGPIDALTLLIYDFATSPYRNWIDVAWGGALVLLLIYIALFVAVHTVFRGVRL